MKSREKKHHYVLKIARRLHFQDHLPIDFGGECALTVAYLIGQTLSKFLSGQTSYEVLHGLKHCFSLGKGF